MSEYPKRSLKRCPTHPGAMLREIVLPALGMTKVQVAEALGVSRQTLYDILGEKQPVTPAMAMRLAAAFGNSPQFWMNMQANHDLWHAAREVDTSRVLTMTSRGDDFLVLKAGDVKFKGRRKE